MDVVYGNETLYDVPMYNEYVTIQLSTTFILKLNYKQCLGHQVLKVLMFYYNYNILQLCVYYATVYRCV